MNNVCMFEKKVKVRIKNGSEELLFLKLNIFRKTLSFVQCLMRNYCFTAMASL